MATRHLIIGGGTAGMNAIRTIREEEGERSEIALVSAETPYSRMVLPYYLDRSIAESHVFTATPRVLADWGVKAQVGRRATALDTKANVCILDDGTRLEYDDCLIATGSSAVDRKSTRLNSSHLVISYAVFCLKKKKKNDK